MEQFSDGRQHSSWLAANCLVNATQVYMQQPGVDTQQFDFTTKQVGQQMGNYSALPHTPVVSRTLNSGGSDIVALASGRAYPSGQYGDAMWGVYFDGQWIGYQANYGSTKTLTTCAHARNFRPPCILTHSSGFPRQLTTPSLLTLRNILGVPLKTMARILFSTRLARTQRSWS